MVIRVQQYSQNVIQNSQRFFALLRGEFMTILGNNYIYIYNTYIRIPEIQQLCHKRALQNLVNK